MTQPSLPRLRLCTREVVWSLASGFCLVAAEFATGPRETGPIWRSAWLLLAYGFGGLDLILHVAGSLRKGHFHLDVDLLMLVAALGAASLGRAGEGAFLLFLFSLAHALEHAALDHAKETIRSMSDLAPATASVSRSGEERVVPIDEVVVGEEVVVRPGDRVPVDGVVSRGRSSVDQSPVTGESMPVSKEVDSEVFAGTINGDGLLRIRATRVLGDRTLDRVVELVTESRKRKSQTQQRVVNFERRFVPAVLAVDLLVLTVPAALGYWDWSTGFYRAMALLVAASPCALALSTPAAVLAAVGRAARLGVLIKGGRALEDLGRIRAAAFDKTGTLTLGRPDVERIVALEGEDEARILAIAAAVERSSSHPLARAILRAADSRGVSSIAVDSIENIPGLGVRGEIDGRRVDVGDGRLGGFDAGEPEVEAVQLELAGAGMSVVWVRIDGRRVGAIGLIDQIRPEAVATLEALRELGIDELVILTGDHEHAARRVASSVGIGRFEAGLMPADKVAAIERLRTQTGPTAMVGDGINDAPALAEATVGIAMAAGGGAVALESADVALLGDELTRLPFAFALGRAATRVIRWNLIISIGSVGILMSSSLLGITGIGVTVAAHEGSTLLVLANALTLLRYGGKSVECAGRSV
ncbi:MAG: heavy metal translocating P-type ATPase [Isosphaeraceae bacterium]|nr:heavy metal translocating P-type ATPase [Isosphaeraceae bacterium]